MLGAIETRWIAGVAKERGKEFSAKHAAVLGILFAHANRETWECWPVQEDIAEASGISVSTVKRVMEDLQKWGVLTVKQGGKNYANTYQLFKSMRDHFQQLANTGILLPALMSELKKARVIV